MTHKELESRLPHRDPMLLLGEAEVQEIDGEKVSVGRTTFRGDEWFLQGHFPGNPVRSPAVCWLTAIRGRLILLG